MTVYVLTMIIISGVFTAKSGTFQMEFDSKEKCAAAASVVEKEYTVYNKSCLEIKK